MVFFQSFPFLPVYFQQQLPLFLVSATILRSSVVSKILICFADTTLRDVANKGHGRLDTVELRKHIGWINRNQLLSDDEIDVLKIYYAAMDLARVGKTYPCNFCSQGGSLHTLWNIFSAESYVWDSGKLVYRYSEADTKRQKSDVQLNAVQPNSTRSMFSVRSDLLPPKSRNAVSQSFSQSTSNVKTMATIKI